MTGVYDDKSASSGPNPSVDFLNVIAVKRRSDKRL